jgi:hypothetical protein
MRSIRDVDARLGTYTVSGSLVLEPSPEDLAVLLPWIMGAAAVGTTFSLADTVPAKYITIDRISKVFTYAGCKISEWTIAASVGEIAKFDCNIIGMTETTATGLATASYPSTWAPFVFTEATVNITGSPVATVRDVSLTGNNAIERRIRLGVATSVQPLEIGLRSYTGTITTDFDALTHYNLFLAGTQTALVLKFDNGPDELTITMNIQFTGETPEVGGFDLLSQSLPFRCISSTTDAAAITAVLLNTETSAA